MTTFCEIVIAGTAGGLVGVVGSLLGACVSHGLEKSRHRMFQTQELLNRLYGEAYPHLCEIRDTLWDIMDVDKGPSIDRFRTIDKEADAVIPILGYSSYHGARLKESENLLEIAGNMALAISYYANKILKRNSTEDALRKTVAEGFHQGMIFTFSNIMQAVPLAMVSDSSKRRKELLEELRKDQKEVLDSKTFFLPE